MKNYSLARMKKTLFFFMVSFAMKLAIGQQNIIRPTELWPDNNGNHIQAHGGGIVKLGKRYYWYVSQREMRHHTRRFSRLES